MYTVTPRYPVRQKSTNLVQYNAGSRTIVVSPSSPQAPIVVSPQAESREPPRLRAYNNCGESSLWHSRDFPVEVLLQVIRMGLKLPVEKTSIVSYRKPNFGAVWYHTIVCGESLYGCERRRHWKTQKNARVGGGCRSVSRLRLAIIPVTNWDGWKQRF
jgi:hypothetical protein